MQGKILFGEHPIGEGKQYRPCLLFSVVWEIRGEVVGEDEGGELEKLAYCGGGLADPQGPSR